jgi:hypothetical protein
MFALLLGWVSGKWVKCARNAVFPVGSTEAILGFRSDLELDAKGGN